MRTEREVPSLLPAHDNRLKSLLFRLAARLTGLDRIDDTYRDLAAGDPSPFEFLQRAIAWLNPTQTVDTWELARIPGAGPCIVVANHPMGAQDGLMLLLLAMSRRADVRFLGNDLLRAVAPLRHLLIPVDVLGSGARNALATRTALRHLRHGGCLVVFPAGMVAPSSREGQGVDAAWSRGVAALQRLANASVVPVWLGGTNDPWFRIAGRIHPCLRTALLPRALLKSRGTNRSIAVGPAIDPTLLLRFASDAERINHLRLSCEVLSRRSKDRTIARMHRSEAAIAEPVDPQLLAAEVRALPEDTMLVRTGSIEVRIARANQIPHLLLEIGRLREVSFRRVGEGSGMERDLDEFDPHYHHLFAWDRAAGVVVGAYRLGLTDQLLAAGGVGSLYTSGFYRFSQQFFRVVHPAIELGRSFVSPEHQRGHLPLLSLWRGIGAFVVRNPRYRHLFGPVSISATHQQVSIQLMLEHLRMHRADPALSAQVASRNPWRPSVAPLQLQPGAIADLDKVSAIVRDVESGARGVPVLLTEYLRLNGTFLAMASDPAFGSVDALLLVDLLKTPSLMLRRYLGEAGANSFLEHHGLVKLGASGAAG